MTPDLDLCRLRQLIHRIVLKADDHRGRYTWQAHDAFSDIEDWANEAERIVAQLQQEIAP